MTNRIVTRLIDLHRRLFFLSTAAFQICLSTSNARTEVSGTVSAMTILSDGNPIIVKENLIIPKNGHITIAKGCKLFFKPFTGIIVEGSLSIEGTPEERVLFTSINDSLSPEKTGQTANPFDWNGILITQQAQNISLKNFIIKYSVYGLKSQNANMTIDNGIFNGNGQFNCTVNDKILPVVDNLAFHYGNERQDPGPHAKDQTKAATWLLPAAMAATVTGTAALCFVAYYLHQRSDYISLYNGTQSQNARIDYFNKRKSVSRKATISGISGGVLLVAGGVLFTIDHNQKKEKNISLCPIIGSEAGILVGFEL
jgi:hypothetical protein